MMVVDDGWEEEWRCRVRRLCLPLVISWYLLPVEASSSYDAMHLPYENHRRSPWRQLDGAASCDAMTPSYDRSSAIYLLMSSGLRDVGSTRHWRVHFLFLSLSLSLSLDSPSLSSSSLKLIKHPAAGRANRTSHDASHVQSWRRVCSCDNTMLRDNGSDFLRPIVALSCPSRGDPTNLFTLFTQHKRVPLFISFSLMIFRSLMASIDHSGNHLIIQLSAPANILIEAFERINLQLRFVLSSAFCLSEHRDLVDDLAEWLVAEWRFSFSHCFLERIDYPIIREPPLISSVCVCTLMRTLFRRRLRMHGAGVAPCALPCAASCHAVALHACKSPYNLSPRPARS